MDKKKEGTDENNKRYSAAPLAHIPKQKVENKRKRFETVMQALMFFLLGFDTAVIALTLIPWY